METRHTTRGNCLSGGFYFVNNACTLCSGFGRKHSGFIYWANEMEGMGTYEAGGT